MPRFSSGEQSLHESAFIVASRARVTEGSRLNLPRPSDHPCPRTRSRNAAGKLSPTRKTPRSSLTGPYAICAFGSWPSSLQNTSSRCTQFESKTYCCCVIKGPPCRQFCSLLNALLGRSRHHNSTALQCCVSTAALRRTLVF